MKELSEKITYLFTIDLWKWEVDGASIKWMNTFCDILKKYPSHIFIKSFKEYLTLKSERDILNILEHFIQKMQWGG